jgi:hypothetical protein
MSWAAVALLLAVAACRHEPMEPPSSTGNGGGGGGGEEETPCDPNVIWFQQQVLPILASNCTNPGQGLHCHHAPVDENDYIQITDYASLMESGIVENGDLLDVINTNDPDDVMPPPPFAHLTPAQRTLIAQWIAQGAQNSSCENSACDTLNVTYSGTIAPIMQARCNSCHSGSNPSGSLDLTTWSAVNQSAMSGNLVASVRRIAGDNIADMPPSGPALSNCRIRQLELWVAQGAPNN